MSSNENSEVEEDDIDDIDSIADDDDDGEESDDQFDECITLGKSTPFQTIKWKFPDTDKCPLDGCDFSFSNRLFALVHFRLNHSSMAMLCTICNIPFASADASNLEQHYEMNHPDESLPTMKTNLEIDDFVAGDFFEDGDEMNDWNDENDIADDDDDDDDANGEKDEYIQLSGCGKQSQWKFPSCLTKCPECSAEFDSRNDIIAHYKEKHSEDTILCYLCDWPILGTNFQTHFRLLHPTDVNPFTFDDEPNKGTSQTEKTQPQPEIEESPPQPEKPEQQPKEQAIDEEDNDLIELNGCDIKTYWLFPNITRCSFQKCSQYGTQFSNRMEAKRHYSQAHAKNAILCNWCEKPIQSPYFSCYRKHFERIHPNEKIPFDEDASSEESIEIRAQSTTGHVTQGNGDVGDSITAHKDEDDESASDDEDNADENLIKLEGCGTVSYWQLPPNLKRCPVAVCRMVFENNSTLKQHYKQEHAMFSILCELCGYPLLVKKPDYFEDHFKTTHPNKTHSYKFAKIPKVHKKRGPKIGTKRKPYNKGGSVNNDHNNHDMRQQNHDMVELSGGDVKTFWQFPKYITKCPDRTCFKEFDDYKSTLQHYRLVHAKHKYSCNLCLQIISVSEQHTLKNHFNTKHPEYKPSNIFGYTGTSLPSSISSSSSEKTQQKKTNAKDTDGEVDDLIVLGGKCNQINYWRFPPHMTRCPSHRCTINFGARSAAIRHFRKKHADSYILCSFCAKPVYAPSIPKLRAHFKSRHPLYSFDENEANNGGRQTLNMQSKQTEQPKNVNVPKKKYAEDDDNGWITLKGCGRNTYWRFPQTNVCPSRVCLLQFSSSSECKNHYKESHAPHMILCPSCDRPIDVKLNRNFLKHHRIMHPGVKMPYEFMIESTAQGDNVDTVDPPQQNGRETNGNNDQGNSDDEEDEEFVHENKRTKIDAEDDLIELNSCGIKSQFRFPKNRLRCLNKRCYSKFKTRAEVIRHYKAAHGRAAIYCEKCKKPVHTTYLPSWQSHCDKWHPQTEPKATDDLKPSSNGCSMAPKPFASEQSSNLMTTKIVCPLKDCSYKSSRMQKIRKHWDKMHGDFRFPLVHEKQFDGMRNNAAANGTDTGHAEERIDQDVENNHSPGNDLDEGLLVPISNSPTSFNDKEPLNQLPAAKRRRTSSAAADVYTFDGHEDEIVEFRKHKSPNTSADGVVCDGNITSTAECSIDLGIIKMEIDSPSYDEPPPEVSLSPNGPGFILGEAHSLRPEDFIIHLESDDESFHSAESTTEVDELNNAPPTTVPNESENITDDKVTANDEMEVTTTSQDCNQSN